MENSNKVKLQSADGDIFEVEIKVAKSFGIIKSLVDALGIDETIEETIPIMNVSTHILELVLKFAEYHQDDEEPINLKEEPISKWDSEFLKVDKSILYDLTLAANFMDIQSLYDLTCKTVANMIRGKNSVEIQELFGLSGNLTLH